MEILSNAVSLLIAALFLQAGTSKLLPKNQQYYSDVIQSYKVLPARLVAAMPRIIGFSEMLIAVLILVPMSIQIGLLMAIGLLVLYSLIFAKLLIQGQKDVNCGCAGSGANIAISPMLLIRNAVLIVLCLIAVSFMTTASVSNWVLVVPSAVVLGLIYLSCDQLIANQQKIEMLRNT